MKYDFSKYSFHPKDELLERYSIILSDLANSNIELSDLLQDEHRQRYESWVNSPEQTVNGKDRDATIQTVHLTTEIHKLRGEIMAQKLEKELIEFLIHERVHT